MTPKDQNLLATLNLLTLLFRAQKQRFPKPSDEEQHTLRITNEYLLKSGLTLPVFSNTLNDLDKKGYLFGFTFISDSQPELDRLMDDVQYDQLLAEAEKVDSPELIEQIKLSFIKAFEPKLPANLQLDREGFMTEDFTLKDILEQTRSALGKNTINLVAVVILMPFRNIERLLEKMNDGVPFEDIKDAGIWYDSESYCFHIDEESISTAHQHKPNKEHYVLKALFSQFGDKSIDYDEVPEFDHSRDVAKELKTYRDALNRFVAKHPRLKEVFTVHADHLEIRAEYLDHTH